MRSPARMLVNVLVGAPLVVVTSCVVGSLDVANKQCPCSSGYVCDVPRNTCVTGLVADAGASSGGPADPDAGSPGGVAPPDTVVDMPPPNPKALVGVTNLRTAWKTPNVIRWEWTVDGKASDWASYTLFYGATAETITNGTAVVLNKDQRPELAAFDARGGGTQGPLTVWAVTPVAQGSTPQFAQVRVTDGQMPSQSNVTSTLEATSEGDVGGGTTIFNGKAVGTPHPPEFVLDGQNEYSFVQSCTAPATACSSRVELVGSPLVTVNGNQLTAATFATAYLEVQMKANVAETSLDSTVAIEIGNHNQNCADADCRFLYSGFTQDGSLPAPSTRVQVPLASLVNGNGIPLSYALMQARNLNIGAIVIGGTWKVGSTLKLTSAAIRY